MPSHPCKHSSVNVDHMSAKMHSSKNVHCPKKGSMKTSFIEKTQLSKEVHASSKKGHYLVI